MAMENELSKLYKESVKHLESMSALELMQNAAMFAEDLEKLMAKYRLPIPVLIGCLMTTVHRLNAETDNIVLDTKLVDAFKLFQIYVDKNFMKKEKEMK